jgi:aryl carrier-like protein
MKPIESALDEVSLIGALDESRDARDEHLAGKLERLIIQIWQEVLGLKSVGRDDNFFQLGGDSLRGMELTERVSVQIDTEVPLVLLFRHPTPREMAREIETIDTNTYAA